MPYESPLQSRRDEGSLSLHELMVLCTNLSNKVTSLEAELAQTKQTYGTALTKLIKKVKKLEQTVKTSQSRRRTRVVLSDEEEVSEDPSKQGRSLIEELDLDAKISLVPPHDAEIQEKISDDTEVLLEEEETAELVEEPTKLVEDQGSGEKGEQEVTTADTALNTASVPISTASATPEVSTAAANLVYIRRSAEKRKDKGKAIMIEDEYVQKKSKKQLEQERLSHEEAIRLQEQIDEEERKRIARDAEIAKQLQEEYDKAGKKEVVAEVDTAHVIDWNDPSVIRYHALQNRPRSVAEVRKNMLMYLKNQGGYKMKDFKGMSYDDIRPIFEKVWDQVHSFVPMDSEEVKKTKKNRIAESNEILKKFEFASVKTASTLIKTQKPLTKDEEAADVDVHLYRSMIGSLMYLTASRPDIMFAVYTCSRFQVTPKTSHLHAVKRIFSECWSTILTGHFHNKGCQFLSKLISWQCKKQTIMVTSTIEAEYVAAANCCGQVLWIQNQMLDYGFNFMNTKIYIDNESTICIVKNPVFHSKTKHIEIRHHFIRDAYEKKLIQVLKIHTDDNVADLLTKAFDVSSSQTVNDEKQIHAIVDSKAVVVTEASIRSSLLLNDARKGLKFSGRITPLFSNMLASAEVEEGEGSAQPTEPQPTPSPTQLGKRQPHVTESSSGPNIP
ncbi:hypothetical protein Tco_0721137 [Tanacetum coccineum]